MRSSSAKPDHPTATASTFPFQSRISGRQNLENLTSECPVVIGNDVWTGPDQIFIFTRASQKVFPVELIGGVLAEWIEDVSDGLAYAARSAVALLDIDNVVIDGAIPNTVRKEIAKATRRKLARILVDRPEPFSVLEGTFGHLGPVIGGASIPLLVKYSNDKELLFKE